MTKYSPDFKMEVINGYLAGMGSTSLYHKFHIPSKRSVLNWVHRYQAKGFSSLKNCEKWPEYTCDFKLDVLNLMKQNHSTFENTALHFKISSPSMIYQWDRRFEAVGVDGLKTKRGRPPMGKRRNPDSTAKKNGKLERFSLIRSALRT